MCMTFSSMGSGTLPASNDTVPGLQTNHPEIHLAMVYGITVAGLVALAVVTVVITIVYHRRREDTRTYHIVSKERGSVRSSAGLIELQHETQSERYTMELIKPQEENLRPHPPGTQPIESEEKSSEIPECSATSYIPEEGDDQRDRTGIYGDNPQQKEFDQFSFEDGAPLNDYPASVDLEVTDSYRDSDVQKAKIMGYPDIYNSQILKTVPPAGEEYITNEKGGKYLTLPMPRTSIKQGTDRVGTSPPTKLNIPTVTLEEGGGCGTRESVNSQLATAHKVSAGFAEAEEFLNRSVCDLLEMTGAMSEEMGQNYKIMDIDISSFTDDASTHIPTNPCSVPHQHMSLTSVRTSQSSDVNMTSAHDLDNDIQRTLLGEDGIEELQISHV